MHDMTTPMNDAGWFAGWTLAQDGSSTGMFGANPGGSPQGTGAGTTTTPANPTGPAPSGPGNSMLFMFMLPLVALVLFSMWVNRKEKKKRESILSAVGKNDQVVTVGGIIGTVTEILDDRIVLRVDDSTKTKMTFTKSAVQQVLRSSNAPETSIETKTKAEKANA